MGAESFNSTTGAAEAEADHEATRYTHAKATAAPVNVETPVKFNTSPENSTYLPVLSDSALPGAMLCGKV